MNITKLKWFIGHSFSRPPVHHHVRIHVWSVGYLENIPTTAKKASNQFGWWWPGQAKWIVGPVDWNSSLVWVSFVQWMSESAYGRRCLWVVNERIPPPPPLVSPGHGLFVGKKCVKVNDLKVARFYCPSPPFNSSSSCSSCFGSGHRMGFPNYVCVGGGQRHRTKL